MQEDKQLILETKLFAKEIRWKSWYYTLSSFFLLIVFLLGTGLLPTIFLRVSSSIFSALLLARCFIIFHDYQHHSILHRSYIANILFTAFGIYMITPPSIWKRSHNHHHNNNSKLFSASIGSFPIMTKQKFIEASDKEKKMYLATRHPVNMLFAYFSVFLYGMCIQSFFSNPRKHWDSLVVVLIHVGAAVFLWMQFGWLTWFLAFFLPFFLSHMLGAYLFYAQHNFPGVVFRNNVHWNYAKAALESSSYMAMNPFWKWVTANIGYHHIHHINARIPFYRLPEAMKKIPALQKVTVTTLNPADIAACLRLKVWDAQQNRMISLKEMNS